MAELLGEKVENAENHDYGLDRPMAPMSFDIKGASNLDWGMKTRLAKIFNPKDGNAVCFAFDHGAGQGPTHGLERPDLLIPQVADYVDVLMATRGVLRTCVDPRLGKPLILRTSCGGSILPKETSVPGGLGPDAEECIRMDALAMAIGINVGAEAEIEHGSIQNLHEACNFGYKYGIPVLGVVTVGREMARPTRYYLLATRMIVEIGCQLIKTYYTEEDFEKVTCAASVPIIIAGGKFLPENEALELTYKAISEGARGVDMGRNIFQSKSPRAMARSIGLVVHEKYTAKQAYDAFLTYADELKSGKAK